VTTLLFNVFGPVLLPLVMIAGAAYGLGRARKVNPSPIAQVAFYLFNPSLVFVALAGTTFPPEMLGRLALLKIVVYLAMLALARLVADRLRLAPPLASAFALVVVSANSGNLGLPMNEYAFGASGLALAVICYVTDNLAVNSVGVYLAARGHANGRQALREVLGNPALYAAPLGILANQVGWSPPLFLARALELLSRAAVPTMLVVLGMQLAALPLKRQHWRLMGLACALRLLAAPAVAMGLAPLLGLEGLARQVGVLQNAVPSAVMTSILAGRYDTEPNLVAGSILISSLASLVTLTALLYWMLR
jgi:predicted permease